jgi:hypothetical protein
MKLGKIDKDLVKRCMDLCDKCIEADEKILEETKEIIRRHEENIKIVEVHLRNTYEKRKICEETLHLKVLEEIISEEKS